MRKPSRGASAVILQFKSPAPPCGANYIKTGIPSEWKPQRIFAEPIYEVEYHKHFTCHITVRLDKFNVNEVSQGSIESFKDIGGKLVAWMRNIPGVQLWQLGSGFAWSDEENPTIVGHWLFQYRMAESQGVFNVWIVPNGAESAMMIAAIDERHLGAQNAQP